MAKLSEDKKAETSFNNLVGKKSRGEEEEFIPLNLTGIPDTMT